MKFQISKELDEILKKMDKGAKEIGSKIILTKMNKK